jgi:hypothetical protein
MLLPSSWIAAASLLLSIAMISCSRPSAPVSATKRPPDQVSQSSSSPPPPEHPREVLPKPRPKKAVAVGSPASQVIDEELAQVRPGLITHNIPPRMAQGKETRVVARIIGIAVGTPDAVKQAEQALNRNLERSKPSENIQITRTMKAELKSAEEDFHIEPQTLEEQIIDAAQPT